MRNTGYYPIYSATSPHCLKVADYSTIAAAIPFVQRLPLNEVNERACEMAQFVRLFGRTGVCFFTKEKSSLGIANAAPVPLEIIPKQACRLSHPEY